MVDKASAIQTIRTLIEQRSFKEAIQHAIEALQQFPDDPELIELRDLATERLEAEPFLQNFMTSGVSLFNSGLYDEALKQFEKVAAIDPNYPELQDWLARCREHQTPAAVPPSPEPSPTATEQLAPNQQKVLQLLEQGQRLFDQGRYDEAIQVWSEVFMYDLTNSEAQKRIQAAQTALKKRRQNLEHHLADLRDAMKQNDFEKAESLIQTILDLDPNNQEALQFQRTLQARKSQDFPMDEELPQGEALDKLVMEALRAHREERWADAVRMWQEVLKAEPDNLGAQSKYGEALRMLRVENQLNRLLEDAQLFMASDKRDSAIHALQKAYRLRPEHPQVRNLMLEWNLTEADLEEFSMSRESVDSSAAQMAEVRKSPNSLLIIVGLIVLFGAGFIGWYTLFHKSENTNVATVQSPAVRRRRPRRRPRPQQKPQPTYQNPPPVASAETAPPTTTPPEETSIKELTPEQIKKRDELVNKARALRTRDIDAAYAAINEAYAIDPNNPQVAQLYNEIQRAVSARDQEIEENLENARRYSRQYDFTGAIFVLNKLRTRYPDHKDILEIIKKAYFNLGLYYLRQVRCGDAADVFEQIELLDPKAEPELLRFVPIAQECIKNNGLSREQEDLVYHTPFLELTAEPLGE